MNFEVAIWPPEIVFFFHTRDFVEESVSTAWMEVEAWTESQINQKKTLGRKAVLGLDDFKDDDDDDKTDAISGHQGEGTEIRRNLRFLVYGAVLFSVLEQILCVPFWSVLSQRRSVLLRKLLATYMSSNRENAQAMKDSDDSCHRKGQAWNMLRCFVWYNFDRGRLAQGMLESSEVVCTVGRGRQMQKVSCVEKT